MWANTNWVLCIRKSQHGNLENHRICQLWHDVTTQLTWQVVTLAYVVWHYNLVSLATKYHTHPGATVNHMQYYTAAIPAAPQQIILLLDWIIWFQAIISHKIILLYVLRNEELNVPVNGIAMYTCWTENLKT